MISCDSNPVELYWWDLWLFGDNLGLIIVIWLDFWRVSRDIVTLGNFWFWSYRVIKEIREQSVKRIASWTAALGITENIQGDPEFMVQALKVGTGYCNSNLLYRNKWSQVMRWGVNWENNKQKEIQNFYYYREHANCC